MRNIAGRKSRTFGDALLSALASKTAIRLKIELRLSTEPEVLILLFIAIACPELL
jgi:hypothetical protein